MNTSNDRKPFPMRSLAILIAVALTIVVAVVFINQSRYFQLKPATGTAAALSQAAAPADGQASRP